MADGLSTDLIAAAFWTVLACGLVAWRDLPGTWAALLAVFRVGVVVAYFAWYYDGTWTTFDDVTYYSQGGDLLALDYTPISILREPGGFDQLLGMAESRHFLFTWLNLSAQYLFGEHYYSMVLLNVWLTFASGYCFARLLDALRFDARYVRYALAFVLLHWDVLVWSSFLNVKDPLVQTLTLATLAALARGFYARRVSSLVALAALYPLFLWTRFYLPLVFLAVTAVWLLAEWNDSRKWLLVPALALGVYLLVPWNSDLREQLDTEHMLLGAARFLLTPAPWQVHEGYGFLFWPSLAHWACIVPTLIGGWLLSRESRGARLALLYTVALIALYSVAEELQGPRHRAQLAFLFAWMQFHVVWRLRRRVSEPAAANPLAEETVHVSPSLRPRLAA